MNATTRMTAYQQFTTTSYNRRNGSIVDVEIPEGAVPVLITTNATDYKTIFRAILTPGPNATDADKFNINALVYGMAWSHRTYAVCFPDDKDAMTANLRNVLAVPFQHTTTAVMFGNYSLADARLPSLPGFALPDDMIKVATGGTSNSRLAIQPWTGWLFVAGDAFIHVVVFVGMMWIIFLRERGLPRSIGLGEIQGPREALRTDIIHRRPKWGLPIWFMTTEPELPCVRQGEIRPLLEVVDEDDVVDEKKNTWQLARMLRGTRVVQRFDDLETGRQSGIGRQVSWLGGLSSGFTK